MLDHGRIHQRHVREIRDVSTCTAQHVRAALSVLHMAQKIVSRQKHNMLSLLYAACLKLLVFFYCCFCDAVISHWSQQKYAKLRVLGSALFVNRFVAISH